MAAAKTGVHHSRVHYWLKNDHASELSLDLPLRSFRLHFNFLIVELGGTLIHSVAIPRHHNGSQFPYLLNAPAVSAHAEEYWPTNGAR